MTVVRWRGVESGSVETCVIEQSDDAITVRSRVRGGGLDCAYTVHLEAGWRFRSLALTTTTRTLRVDYDDGVWAVDGRGRTDLAAAREIDISVTPLTNTLPIQRLSLTDGEHADITTAYIAVPDLTVTADPQRYTRLTADTYRYESLDSDFERVVSVDEHGLVLDYPGLFVREH